MPDGTISNALGHNSGRVRKDWIVQGRRLGDRERSAQSLMWDIGDWWNAGEAYGDRAEIVKADDWTGPTYANCRRVGSVAARFQGVSRLTYLTFEHHAIVAPLPNEDADNLLQWCLESDPPHSTQELKAKVKQLKRVSRETQLADRIEQETERLGVQVYGVIYADPPWRFEPYSRDSGMDRAADNHYPTMDPGTLAALDLPAGEDCVLFLWATIAMLPDALAFLADHGFSYRSAYGWLKPGPGTGYWSQSDQLELLLVGTRGEVPAPAPGTQPPQVQTFPRGRHSEKPDAFAAMIEAMFPNTAKLEMFARSARVGWDSWGAEAETAVSGR